MFATHTILDPVTICPYNRNHLIPKSRLQKHLVKCEKNYPEGYKVLCPYDATHRIFPSELEDHTIKCPMKTVVIPAVYQEPKNHGFINFMLQSEISSTIDCDENWDEEEHTPSVTTNHDNDSLGTVKSQEEKFDSSLQGKHIDETEIRPPRGFSEAMLKEVSIEPYVEDAESVVSSMGLGRGRISKQATIKKLAGIGRGQPLNKHLTSISCA